MGQKLVGILLNAAMHRGVPRLKTGQESLAVYEEAAAGYGMVPCFLQLSDINLEPGYSVAYVKGLQGYQRTVVPTPAVIHNRAFFSPGSTGIERLLGQGLLIFNTCNRYGKDQIHGLLQQNEALRGFLPDSAAGLAGLRDMVNRHHDLILKPCRGSVGKGVMRLSRKSGSRRWIWTYLPSGSRRYVSRSVSQENLHRVLRARFAAMPYLVQERIPLAEMNGRPFDLRVTVQRGWGGDWQVTGMFAKLAAPGGFVSNIARGGEAFSASAVLEQVFSGEAAASIRMSVQMLSLSIARQLERSLPGLADIGLDIGVTKDRRLYFIECNGRDQRYGFQKAGLSDTWKDSYRRPMGYARYLLDDPSRYIRY